MRGIRFRGIISWVCKGVFILLLFIFLIGGLFVLNGLVLAHRETPVSGRAGNSAVADAPDNVTTIKLFALNMAKGFVQRGNFSFQKPALVRERMRQIVELIQQEQPDIAFLSETIFECAPCPVNQVTTLAEQTALSYWLFGENYNIGLPFYRLSGGNAILSRWPLTPVTNLSLIGRKPFYVTKNNRRMLFGQIRLNQQDILLGAVHNDSYSLRNNLAQTQQMLQFLGRRPAFLGGDFNAQPHEPPIRLLAASGQFSGAFDGALTFPTKNPQQKIDFLFAPSDWECIEYRTIPSSVSDHLPIISVFRKRV